MSCSLPSLHLEEPLPPSHTVITPAQGCPHRAGPAWTSARRGRTHPQPRLQLQWLVQEAKRRDTETGRGTLTPSSCTTVGFTNLQLLRLQLKTPAKHQEPPEGLGFTQASSNHTYGIRLKQPPSLKSFRWVSSPHQQIKPQPRQLLAQITPSKGEMNLNPQQSCREVSREIHHRL